jgi:hypothetical protein
MGRIRACCHPSGPRARGARRRLSRWPRRHAVPRHRGAQHTRLAKLLCWRQHGMTIDIGIPRRLALDTGEKVRLALSKQGMPELPCCRVVGRGVKVIHLGVSTSFRGREMRIGCGMYLVEAAESAIAAFGVTIFGDERRTCTCSTAGQSSASCCA